MRRFPVVIAIATLLASVSQLAVATPRSGARRFPIAASMLAAVQAAGAQNVCFAYGYDRNGNRISKTNLTWGSGTWGSSVFGCFKWRATS
jgi:hypothetical protein